MNHLTQAEIDQFVSSVEIISSNIFELKDHINECDFCSKRIEETLSFTVNVSKFLQIDSSPKMRAFIKKISTTNKETFVADHIPLTFHIPNKSFAVHFAESASVPDVHSKYQYIGSLITKQEDILVRVMKDNISKNIYLFLISNKKRKYQNMVVTLSNCKTKYQSDSHGKIKLGMINIHDIETLTVTIKSK